MEEIVENPNFKVEYTDKFGHVIPESQALVLRFELPYTDEGGNKIYGFFSRNTVAKGFIGVVWNKYPWMPSRINLYNRGYVDPNSLKVLSELSGEAIGSLEDLNAYIKSDLEFFNGAGYQQWQGQPVEKNKAKFIRFQTALKDKNGNDIFGWFVKQGGDFKGLIWGNESEFQEALILQRKTLIGRMVFADNHEANAFLDLLAARALEEPWSFEKKENGRHLPILRSYIQHELNRLFYEQDECKKSNKIVYNEQGTKVLFNTNLVDKFGNDIRLCGKVQSYVRKGYIVDVTFPDGGRQQLEQWGFDQNAQPEVPEFFEQVEELLFHPDWDVDLEQNRDKCEHIIEDNRNRFPEDCQGKSSQKLANDLRAAVDFAKRIAKRNYKFIIPMYYPKFHRIQLLMPIYLDCEYKEMPDFALVLTPKADGANPQNGYYVPETILGLDEVYQDARLIAKPEESWLNPKMIR